MRFFIFLLVVFIVVLDLGCFSILKMVFISVIDIVNVILVLYGFVLEVWSRFR